MWNIRLNIGLLCSAALHILIMSIPVSITLAEKVHDKGEGLFVIYEKNNIIQESKVEKTEVLSVKRSGAQSPSERHELKKEKTASIVEETAVHEATDHLMQKVTTSDSETLQEPEEPEIKPVKEVATEPDHSGIGTGKTTFPAQQFLSDRTSAQDVKFGVVGGPDFLHKELPGYPPIAKRLGKEGKVVLRLTINVKGNLVDVEVLEGADYGFTEAAVRAVRKSTFLPARRNGKPVTSRVILPVRFMLRRN